jgi:pimeloyl-ACP methyl ester carboxylesterase
MFDQKGVRKMNNPESNWLNGWTIILVSLELFVSSCRCQQVAAQPAKIPQSLSANRPNLTLPTLGGTQYWTDIRVTGGWKIQCNAVMERYRLIDSADVRQAIGELAECEKVLEKNLANGTIKPLKGKVVLLLHGLLRSNDSMATLAEYLQENGGYEVINLAYASSQASIDVHATNLRKVIDGLDPEITEINFVAHSMGNIVTRRYLKAIENAPDPRFHRMVMLAPPNQGSEKARSLGRNTRLFEKVAGPSGLQLGLEWNQLAPNLATPKFEFGIIIGGKEKDEQTIPDELDKGLKKGLAIPQGLVEVTQFQPYDFTVSVEEAKLAGASDFVVGPYFHWNIKYHPESMKQTLCFLKNGKFIHVATDPFDGVPISKDRKSLDREIDRSRNQKNEL